MFKILGKYEVMIPEEDEMKLEGLPNAWMSFQQCLIDSTAMLKKHKVSCLASFCTCNSCMYILHVIHVHIYSM